MEPQRRKGREEEKHIEFLCALRAFAVQNSLLFSLFPPELLQRISEGCFCACVGGKAFEAMPIRLAQLVKNRSGDEIETLFEIGRRPVLQGGEDESLGSFEKELRPLSCGLLPRIGAQHPQKEVFHFVEQDVF